MSEHDSGQIEDKKLAEEMAYAENPYRELAADALRQADEAADAVQQVQGTEKMQTKQAETRNISPERLSEILRNSAVSAYGWFSSRGVPDDKYEGISRFSSAASEPVVMGEAARSFTKRELLGEFLHQRITEVVTVRSPKRVIPVRRAKPTSYKPDENLAAIDYEVSTDGKDSVIIKNQLRQKDPATYRALSYSYFANSPKSGKPLQVPKADIFRMSIFLPESDAQELVQAIQGDTQTIRDTVDLAMRQEIEASEMWDEDGVRPPYEDWKELNGGVNRIALRDDMKKGPEQREILEF
jgi:hypothetical protein